MNNLMGVGVSRNDLNAWTIFDARPSWAILRHRLRLDIFMTPAPWCRKTPAKLRTGTRRRPNRMIAWPSGCWDVSTTQEPEFRETSMPPSHGYRKLQTRVTHLGNNCWDSSAWKKTTTLTRQGGSAKRQCKVCLKRKRS